MDTRLRVPTLTPSGPPPTPPATNANLPRIPNQHGLVAVGALYLQETKTKTVSLIITHPYLHRAARECEAHGSLGRLTVSQKFISLISYCTNEHIITTSFHLYGAIVSNAKYVIECDPFSSPSL